MTTLKQRFIALFKNESVLSPDYFIKETKEWLQQKPQEFSRDFMTISKDEYDLIEEFVRKLLEELET